MDQMSFPNVTTQAWGTPIMTNPHYLPLPGNLGMPSYNCMGSPLKFNLPGYPSHLALPFSSNTFQGEIPKSNLSNNLIPQQLTFDNNYSVSQFDNLTTNFQQNSQFPSHSIHSDIATINNEDSDLIQLLGDWEIGFFGKQNEDVEYFLRRLSTFVRSYNVSDETILRLVPVILHERAESWSQNLARNWKSYEDFKLALQVQYGKANTQLGSEEESESSLTCPSSNYESEPNSNFHHSDDVSAKSFTNFSRSSSNRELNIINNSIGVHDSTKQVMSFNIPEKEGEERRASPTVASDISLNNDDKPVEMTTESRSCVMPTGTIDIVVSPNTSSLEVESRSETSILTNPCTNMQNRTSKNLIRDNTYPSDKMTSNRNSNLRNRLSKNLISKKPLNRIPADQLSKFYRIPPYPFNKYHLNKPTSNQPLNFRNISSKNDGTFVNYNREKHYSYRNVSYACWVCHIVGHFAKDCPKKLGILCYKCGKPGTIIPNAQIANHLRKMI